MAWFPSIWSGLKTNSPAKPEVRATNSAIAVAGDIRNSNITVGLDEFAVAEQIQNSQRPLAESFAELATQIAREKGIDAAPLRAILARLGELHVSDDQIPSRLSVMADEFIELRQSLETNTSDNLSSAKNEALQLLNEGDFSSAYAILERGRLASRLHRENATRDEAEFLSDQARIDELQLSYVSAAAKYSEAAILFAEDASEAFKYLVKQANALQNQGEEFGDNEALNASIAIWRQARELRPFDIAPEDHRKAHNNLGSAILSMAMRETGNEGLYEVVALNREVLARDTRHSAPKSWVAATANLASALQAIGEREKNHDVLLEAVGLSREVLSEVDQLEEPLKWAGIQNNIGNTFKFIAEDHGNEEPLETAIAAYTEALAVLGPETDPSLRAMLLMNLAASHIELGRFRNHAEPLERGIIVLNEVLQLAPKERYPMQWANTKLNLSSALNSLGIVTNDVRCFETAILASNDALAIYTRDSHPLHWANCRWGIGTALRLTAERTQDATQARTAVQILSEVNDILIRTDDERLKPRIAEALSEAVALQKQLNDSLEFHHRDDPTTA